MKAFEVVSRYYSQVVYADSEAEARQLFSEEHPARWILYVTQVFNLKNDENSNKR